MPRCNPSAILFLAGAALWLNACSGSDGNASPIFASASVSPETAPPTVTLTASPTHIVAGASTALTWSSTNTTSCDASGAWSGSRATQGKSSVAPAVAGTYAYKLTCSGAGGSESAVASIAVGAAPHPLLVLTPTSVLFGAQVVGTTSAVQSVALTNSGTDSSTNIAISSTGDFKAHSDCGTMLAPKATCSISVSFTPAATGSSTGTLNITSGGQSPIATLSGLGIAAPVTAAPVLSVSPVSLAFANQFMGTTSAAQAVILTNTGTANVTGLGVSATGDYKFVNSCATALAPGAHCTVSVMFGPTAVGVRPGTMTIASNASVVDVPLSGAGVAPAAAQPMALISLGQPTAASSAQYPASYANDNNYNTDWRSVGVPASLSLDLSQVPVALREKIWLVWYNETYAYDHTLINEPGYNNPGAYTVEANAAPGGGPPPPSGWVVMASLTANTLHSYSYVLNFSGYNWVQLNFTASDGSPLNTDIAMNLDVYGVTNGITDGWFFNGDSITANCMGHADIYAQDENNPTNDVTVPALSFGQQVNAIVGNNTPLQENGGIPYFTSGDMIPYLAPWLANIPSRYVTINLGTNDAAEGVAPSVYYANMQRLISAVTAAGKIPIVPTIPYSLDPVHQANEPALNDEIKALYAANPAIVPGPDLWTYFKNNPQYISTDNIHPNAQGCAAYRALWAQFAASSIY